jgi:hypothetical protein
VLATLALSLLQLVFVSAGQIGELQRVDRTQLGIPLLEGVGIEQEINPVSRPEPEMVGAFRANSGVPVQLFRIDQLLTLWALNPKVFRNLNVAVLVRIPGPKLGTALEKFSHRRPASNR